MLKTKFLKLIVIRYSGLVFLFLSYLLIAKKMEAAEYGKVMFAIFMANIISLLRFGSHTGYVNYYFNKHLWKNDYLKDSYLIGSFLHLGFNLLVIFLLNKVFNLDLNYSLIIFSIMLFYYVIEPILRVRDLLLIISIDKLILSICLFIMYWQNYSINISIFINYYLLAYCLYYLLLIIKYSNLLKVNLKKIKLKKYFLLIKEGFLININTVLFSIIQGIDLLLIKYFFPANVLGNYSFAKQLLNGIYYFFTTLALVQNNNIGKLIDRSFELKEYVAFIFKRNLVFLVASYIGILILAKIIEIYYDKYTIFSFIVLVGLFYLLTGITNSMSTILFLRHKTAKITKLISFFIFLFFVISYIILNYAKNVYLVLGLYSLIMFLYNLTILFFVKKEIE